MRFPEFFLLHYAPKINQSILPDAKTVARRLAMRFRYTRGHCAGNRKWIQKCEENKRMSVIVVAKVNKNKIFENEV